MSFGRSAGKGEVDEFLSASLRHPRKLASGRWTEDDPNWLVTLSDLTLLLVCFLAVWHVKDAKQPPALNVATAPAAASSGPANVLPAVPLPVPEDPWMVARGEMQALIAEKGLNGKIHLESASSGFVISIADMVSFDSGTADLRHEARPILDAVALLVQSRPGLRVEVSGHTDRRRIATAKFPSNWELSTARASRAARYLIEKGVDPSRIEARGFASQRPRARETDPASGRANRRVEIRLYQPAQPTATDSTR